MTDCVQRKVFDEIVKREIGEFDLSNRPPYYMQEYCEKRVELFRQFIEDGYQPICHEELQCFSGQVMVCVSDLCFGPCPQGELCSYATMISNILKEHVYPHIGRG